MTPAIASEELDTRPAAILRGGAKGLEIIAQGKATAEAIADALHARLDEAPGFFKGSDVRVRVEEGPLPAGALAKLDEIAGAFDLRIVEVSAAKPPKAASVAPAPAPEIEAIPEPQFAAGSTGTPEPVAAAPIEAPAPAEMSPSAGEAAGREAAGGYGAKEEAAAAIEAIADDNTTRVVVGPVRSGVILDHRGHLVVFGDVNPGAEVRAAGNIVVLGRLRGTAHAAIGRDTGFILSLRLEPQQLRIGRMVARAGDGGEAATEAEIAHVSGEGIVVERYQGRLPRNLVASI